MESQTLVVSDPPHDTVDHDAVASLLGLEIDDALPKIAFWAPEVLSASEPDRDGEVAQALRRLGMNVALIDAAELAGVPWPRPASSLTFESEGLIARLASTAGGAVEEVEVAYDQPLFGVYCSPPDGFVAPVADETEDASPSGAGAAASQRGGEASSTRGLAIAEAIQWQPTLDLYFKERGALARLTVAPDYMEPLAPAASASGGAVGASNDTAISDAIGGCQRNFRQMTLDARLRDVWPRQRFQMGASGFDLDLRKLFSYGTLLLRQALQSASPELGDLPQYELGSRMAYVLRHRPTAL